MPAARYWRLVGVTAYAGGDLELSEIALWDGLSRVGPGAVISSTHAPVSGALEHLLDQNLNTSVRFAASDMSTPRFAIQWDFGSAQNLTAIQFGSVTQERFIDQFALQYFSDGRWVTLTYATGHVYQGDGVLQGTISRDPLYPSVHSVYDFGQLVRASDDYYASGEASGGTLAYVSTLGANALRGGSMPVPELSGDFCLEFWAGQLSNSSVEFLMLPSNYRFQTLSTGWGNSHTIHLENASGTQISAQVSSSYPAWRHMAWSRQGGVNRFFHSGAPVGSAFVDATVHPAGLITLSTSVYLRAFRLTLGHPRYESAFATAYPFPSRVAEARRQVLAPSLSLTAYPVPAPAVACASGVGISPLRGNGQISGTVKKLTPPSATASLARRVVLRDSFGLDCRDFTVSDPDTGAFVFHQVLENQAYTVIAQDHDNVYRAAIVDRVFAK